MYSCNLRASTWMKVDHTRQSYFLRDLDGSSMTKIDTTHTRIPSSHHNYRLLPCRISPIKAELHIRAQLHQCGSRPQNNHPMWAAPCMLLKKEKNMMELDQTSPFKRLTESQYLLSKAGHEEARQEGRLRPPSSQACQGGKKCCGPPSQRRSRLWAL